MDTLIAESGGTKTDWLRIRGEDPPELIRSEGLNPNVVGWELVQKRLLVFAEAIEDLPIGRLYFFGAGLALAADQARMTRMIRKILSPQIELHLGTDLEGAALAGLNQKPGVVGILGTGSVAFKFDGTAITDRRGGHGYLLGDEGSGSGLGQEFLKHLMAQRFDANLNHAHLEYSEKTPAQWRRAIYQAPSPLPFFTVQAPFMSQFRDHPQIQKILHDQFEAFFKDTVRPLMEPEPLPLVLFGGISREFSDILKPWCEKLGWSCRIPDKPPIWGLAEAIRSRIDHESGISTAGISGAGFGIYRDQDESHR